MSGENNRIDSGPMLNAYPDSMGGTLGDIVDLLKKEEFQNVFSSFYILPSVFHTDFGPRLFGYRLFLEQNAGKEGGS